MQFVGLDDANERMEVMELDGHPYYVGVQYHPEYTSRPLRPSPPFLGLILAAKQKLQTYFDNGCRLAPCREYSDSDGSLSSCGNSTDDDDTIAAGRRGVVAANGTTATDGNGDALHEQFAGAKLV